MKQVMFLSKKLSLRLKLGIVLFIVMLTALPVSAAPLLQGVISGGEIWAGWTWIDNDNAIMQFTNVTGTAIVSNKVNLTSSGVTGSGLPGGANYPSVWYTPTPPGAHNWLILNVANLASPTPLASFDVTFTFSKPIVNPKFHILNTDIGTLDFSATPGIALTRVSGNNEFEVTGTVVNSTPNPANNTGCEANDTTNDNGACGTVTLNGIYQTIVMRVTDTDGTTSSGDGFFLTISLVEPVATAVGGVAEMITVPTTSMNGLGYLAGLVGVVMLVGAGWLVSKR